MLTSIELAQEYGKAGKTRRATKILGQVMEVVKSGKMNEEVGALFYLRFAETMALAEDIDNSSALYQVAISTAESISPEDKTAPTMERIHARVGRLERAAVAAQVVSFIQVSKVRCCSAYICEASFSSRRTQLARSMGYSSPFVCGIGPWTVSRGSTHLLHQIKRREGETRSKLPLIPKVLLRPTANLGLQLTTDNSILTLNGGLLRASSTPFTR